MTKLIIKSLFFGFIVGVIFIVIAPLALGIAFIENLRPILIPGVALSKSIWPTADSVSTGQWIFAILVNGLVYSILFFAVLLARKNIVGRKTKLFIIVVIMLIFLLITGMLTNLYALFISPNKS